MGAFPELSAKGAYSSKEVYSLDDIQQIVRYANEVSVISTRRFRQAHLSATPARHRCHHGTNASHHTYQPHWNDTPQEMDSPGHTNAISAAHPEHIACAAKSPWSTYASEPPAGQLRIASLATLAFARTMFASVAATLSGTMMSSGGDEVNLPCWEEDAETVADLARRNITIGDALNEFVQGVQGVIKEHGKTPFIKSG